MNSNDRKQLEIAHLKLDDVRQDIVNLKNDMDKAHDKVSADLSFIKENLFNPHKGLWAETKLNSEFRRSTSKWRGIIGAGVIGLIFKQLIDVFNT